MIIYLLLAAILGTFILWGFGIVPRFVAGVLLLLFVFGAIGWSVHQICLVTGMSLKSIILLGVIGVASFIR